jgi:Domain of unknown function (DUF4288)
MKPSLDGEMWYCIHAILYFEYLDGNQSDYTVWEHIYLVTAPDPRTAYDKGELRAKRDAPISYDGFSIDDRPAQLKFAKIRKVVECQDLNIQNGQPEDGTELSYSEFLISDSTEFENLLANRPATVVYTDR